MVGIYVQNNKLTGSLCNEWGGTTDIKAWGSDTLSAINFANNQLTGT